MRVLLVGTNHRCAQVTLREKLAITPDNIPHIYATIKNRFPQAECVVLSTCNRTEFYIAKPIHAAPTAEHLRQLLAEIGSVTYEEVLQATIEREQQDAVQHLFRTASGLDSRILGESQILGQVKRAYEHACDFNHVGPTLHKVFQNALATAKNLRHQTAIGTNRLNVGTVAIDFAREVFADFSNKTILTIGAGEMIESVLPHLMAQNPAKLWMVNRTAERAQKLADQFNLNGESGGVRSWDDLPPLLVEADFIVTCTASNTAVLDAKQLKQAAKQKRYRPTCIADLGVPRDVDPKAESIRNLYLHNIDDLQHVVADNQAADRHAALQCESEINAASAATLSQILHRDLGVMIKQLKHKLQQTAQIEQTRTIKRLANLSTDTHTQTPDKQTEQIEQILAEHDHRLINKILHLPLTQLNQHDGQAPLGFYAAALRRLFDLHPDPPIEQTPSSTESQTTTTTTTTTNNNNNNNNTATTTPHNASSIRD